MGFFTFGGGDKSTSAYDERQAADGQGIVQRQGGTVGGANPVSIGSISGATVATGGALAASNSSDVNTGGGLIVRGGGNVAGGGSILLQGGSKLEVSSDPQVIRDALATVSHSTDTFQGTLKDLFTLQSDQQTNQRDNVASLIDSQAQSEQSFLDKFSAALSGLAANAQTGGATDRNKIILYMALGVLAVVALIFWRQK